LYYLENRFDSAAAEYLKARALDDSQKKLSRADRNLLLDGLGLSQAQGRHYDDAISTYKAALAEDAEYALFEYNLACTYAMKGDLDSALPHLTKSWELRDSLPNGVEFPDPRKDDSFKRYWNDSRFKQAVENIVV
jgi:tetratricopeptide (TPR) repeat protein